MKITIPDLSLVVLIGSSGSGKSTFAKKHFKATEVLSSDFCRGLVSDDENDLSSTNDAFEVLHYIASKRLARGGLTVIDATNVQHEARKPLIALARQYHCLPVAIVFDVSEDICQERNRVRPERNFAKHVVKQHISQLRRSLKHLKNEGFRHIFILDTQEKIEKTSIERTPLWNNKRHEHGSLDIIGDVHGCFDELVSLLNKLGYVIKSDNNKQFKVIHPDRRKVVFLGDIIDRGPKIIETLHLIMSMNQSEVALCVPGNHDMKLVRKYRGKNVQISHGLAETLSQLEKESNEFKDEVINFLDKLTSHYVFDDGKLVVAHAGMREEMQGRGSGKVRDFAMYGETTGETDEFGLPVRYNWAAEYRGKATVVYGHTPVPKPEWLNRTINIDTGCVFGGALTALRYPELELVSVPVAEEYFQPVKPIVFEQKEGSPLATQQQLDDVLDIEDIIGKRIIETKFRGRITIREENAIAALEAISRFAVNPKWLIYLPPTMSPSETSNRQDLLEYPQEAFAYFRKNGIAKVVCEQKHMGSRAIVIICKDEDVVRKKFGIVDEGTGMCYTRTGRRFFDNKEIEFELLQRVNNALDKSGFWNNYQTDWTCLDCELMPWSAKAQVLIREQYAAVGSSGLAALAPTLEALEQAKSRSLDISNTLQKYQNRQEMILKYTDAYRNYCWPVNSVSDYKLAPFHVMATEGRLYVNENHVWHMETLANICSYDKDLLLATPFKEVDLSDERSEQEGISWWNDLTARGGEGMVVKPFDFISKSKQGLLQPALKCRGKEYLRIIYGPEYTASENLERLRKRYLASKRSLALREFALGIEGLDRFILSEPLRRVHECVFGVLALESEPVDPRL